MEPKTFLFMLFLLTVLDDSPAWVVLTVALCLVLGWTFGPVYRKLLNHRERHA